MIDANTLRGEVDLELDGQSFVLRPSYEAILKIENAVGQALVPLAVAAQNGTLSSFNLAIITAELIRAWGSSLGKGDTSPQNERAMAATARGVSAQRIGELIFDVGIASVLPRVALALHRAASGGCLPSGEPKPATRMTTPAIPAAGSAE